MAVAPTPVLLPGKSMDGGAWWAIVHGVAKSRTRLSDFTFTFLFHALEKEMATHSSVLVWRIPGTGEGGETSKVATGFDSGRRRATLNSPRATRTKIERSSGGTFKPFAISSAI